ncbi:MAG: EAL domain-containing protein [Vicinamibacterales bacterium]
MVPSSQRPPTRRSAGRGSRGLWAGWTTPYDRNHPEAAAFRSLQVQATLALTPWVVYANWTNILVVGWTFRDAVPPWMLGAWMAATALVSAAGIPAWRRWKAGRWPQHVSARTLTRVSRHAAALALLWALPVALGYGHAAAEHRPLLVGITVGMICAGGFALFPAPRAAFGYVFILSGGLAIGFASAAQASQTLPALLLVGYAGIVLATVVTSSRQLGGRLTAEAESARQKRVVDHLLDDFQESARDWLWEVDADGRLQHVSPRLVEALEQPADSLLGQPFVDLFDESRDAGATSEGAGQLRRAIDRSHAFRDLHVALTAGGRRRWWALSGKRLLTEDGRSLGWRGVGTDVTRSRQQNADLVRLANIDALTGLANRHQFRTVLGGAAGRAFSLFYLDLDDFKAVNDLHGHQMGDRVLAAVAARFRGLVRSGDLLARIGGDEFALLSWQATDVEGASILASRLIDALRAPFALDDIVIRIGTCVGIVLAGPNEASGEEMTRLADMALYEAKAQGRNTFMFFHASMEEAARRRVELIGALHGAVERGEFELHYQPLVNPAAGTLSGAESLIRWRHPDGGVIQPADFVALAEESGHILPIGRWVLREACRTAAAWPEGLRVAVNLSALHFSSPSLVDDVCHALDTAGLAPRRLELEITESLVMRNLTAARATLDQLRALGVRIALDDFGTGYSSLSHLRRLPLDTIKIDGAFVRDLGHDTQALAVVRAAVGLAQALHMTVTAEGVETTAQFEVLKRLGIDDAQGFLLARPMPSGAFQALAADWGLDRAAAG